MRFFGNNLHDDVPNRISKAIVQEQVVGPLEKIDEKLVKLRAIRPTAAEVLAAIGVVKELRDVIKSKINSSINTPTNTNTDVVDDIKPARHVASYGGGV